MTVHFPDAHDPAASQDNRLVVAISSRALFDLGDSHSLFERDGLDAYRQFQIEHEEDILKPGVAFPLVQKLLGLNRLAGDVPPVEVILLSRNSGDTGLRIFNAIQHYGLEISRAAFTSGAPTSDYVAPFKADLFLSANAEDVGRALAAGVAAATILPSTAPPRASEQLRIAFDGDAVIFGDEGERVSREEGLAAFHRSEHERAAEPLSVGTAVPRLPHCRASPAGGLSGGELADPHRAGHRPLRAGAQAGDPDPAQVGGAHRRGAVPGRARQGTVPRRLRCRHLLRRLAGQRGVGPPPRGDRPRAARGQQPVTGRARRGSRAVGRLRSREARCSPRS